MTLLAGFQVRGARVHAFRSMFVLFCLSIDPIQMGTIFVMSRLDVFVRQ